MQATSIINLISVKTNFWIHNVMIRQRLFWLFILEKYSILCNIEVVVPYWLWFKIVNTTGLCLIANILVNPAGVTQVRRYRLINFCRNFCCSRNQENGGKIKTSRRSGPGFLFSLTYQSRLYPYRSQDRHLPRAPNYQGPQIR